MWVISVFINWIGGIFLQCTHVSNNHNEHFKYSLTVLSVIPQWAGKIIFKWNKHTIRKELGNISMECILPHIIVLENKCIFLIILFILTVSGNFISSLWTTRKYVKFSIADKCQMGSTSHPSLVSIQKQVSKWQGGRSHCFCNGS